MSDAKSRAGRVPAAGAGELRVHGGGGGGGQAGRGPAPHQRQPHLPQEQEVLHHRRGGAAEVGTAVNVLFVE